MSWTKVQCERSGCDAQFTVDNELQHRDCHVCGFTMTAPWGPHAVDRSGSTQAAKEAKARRDAVASEPVTIDVEINGLKANHIANVATQAGKEPAEFVIDAAVSRASAELRVDQPVHSADVHKRAIAKILQECERVAPCDLYDEYQRHIDAPRTKRTVRNYLDELIDAGQVRAYGSGPARTYSWDG